MKRRMLLLVALCVISLSSVSFAALNDVNPPAWRGLPGSTMQVWDFSYPDNPAIPEVVVNPYGNPTVTLTEGQYYPTYNGADGVWRVTAIGSIDVYIPNTQDTGPDTWKEIILQISYADPYGQPGWEIPILTVPAAESVTRVDSLILPNGYYHDTYHIIIRPNPPEEIIDLVSIQCAMYVDQIIVDTICLPEPATISMLGLGLLGFIKRR